MNGLEYKLPDSINDQIERGALDWVTEHDEGAEFVSWIESVCPETDQLSELEIKA
jgi:hypothetical protein